jgi:hypothetical protein
VTENLRSHGTAAYGDARPEFGVLEGPAGRDGTRAVRAAYVRTSPYPAVLTALTEQEADAWPGGRPHATTGRAGRTRTAPGHP